MIKKLLFIILVSFMLFSMPGFPSLAQEDVSVEDVSVEETDTSTDPDIPDDDIREHLRLDLAKKMHEITPTETQVKMAVERMAYDVPEEDREAFKKKMFSAIDIEKLEQNSIDAMVEVFSLEELERMVAYYMTPEAQSISRKMPIYQGIIQPEIIKMLDNALLEMRTGSGKK